MSRYDRPSFVARSQPEPDERAPRAPEAPNPDAFRVDAWTEADLARAREQLAVARDILHGLRKP